MEGSLVAYKVFTNGSTLQASELNENLMQQSIAVFSNAAARTAAITSPVEGQMTWLEDVNRYESYNGTSWIQLINPNAWVTYTPTISNVTLGNGTVTARYNVIGKTMFIRFRMQLGSTSSVTGAPIFSIPSGFTSAFSGNFPVGEGFATISGANYILTPITSGTGFINAWTTFANSTYTVAGDMSATQPATWGNGSLLEENVRFEIV
jgi:hypothetical protein